MAIPDLPAEPSTTLHGANLREANLYFEAHLEGANLYGATRFFEVHFEGANLEEANLYYGVYGTNLKEADLSRANLEEANLEGANISNAKLLGTKCCMASVDGQTVITNCEINDKTDFTSVGLSGLRIDPELHTRLLRNIRTIRWEKWYAEKKILPFLDKFLKQLYEPFFKWFSKSQVKAVLKRIWHILDFFKRLYEPFFKWFSKSVKTVWHMFESLVMRVFWWISNYGTSTKRIIGSFSR